MARFVKIGKFNEMINVEQITHIYANEKLKNYTVCMVNGSEHDVTYDEFLEITGQQQHQSSDNKKYAVRVLKRGVAASDISYLNFNYSFNLVSFADKEDFGDWRASFTKNEIEKLKKRDDIAIDWDKVELEEVEDA